MRSAEIYYNGILAGLLSEYAGGYRFVYDKAYLAAPTSRAISLTMPLRETAYESPRLFPAFANRLSEGSNKALQLRMFKIDEGDLFGLLLATGGNDSIGPLTVKQIDAHSGN